MMEEYIGENSKTKYLKVINRLNLFHIIYLAIINMLIACIVILLLKYGINSIVVFFKYISYILCAILAFVFFVLLVFIIAKLVIIVKNLKLIRYYKSNPLINVRKIMINYDYKLWLTAVKDSFHPISFIITDNDKAVTYKTGIYFTNSEKYNKIFKFKMPNILIARSYIDAYALIGYDTKNDEMIIIQVEKQ